MFGHVWPCLIPILLLTLSLLSSVGRNRAVADLGVETGHQFFSPGWCRTAHFFCRAPLLLRQSDLNSPATGVLFTKITVRYSKSFQVTAELPFPFTFHIFPPQAPSFRSDLQKAHGIGSRTLQRDQKPDKMI